MSRSTSFALAFVAFATASTLLTAQESQPAKPAAALSVTVPTFVNATCPIMGKPASAALFVDTDKGRIYMCCLGCTKKIKADAEKAHKAAFPKTEVTANKTCPVNGAPITAASPTVVLQGHEFKVATKECVAKAQSDSQIVLTKVTRPDVVDIGNTVCPVTGGAVADNAFCVIGTSLVHLSSAKAVDEVMKDPKAALEKARASKRAPAPAAKPQ